MKHLLIFLLTVVFAITALISCNNKDANKSIKTEKVKSNTPDVTISNETVQNLKTAYKIEMGSHAKCIAYAQKTRDEDIPHLSVMFLAIAKAKEINANNIKTEIEKLKGTVDTVIQEYTVLSSTENLHELLKNETFSFMNLYPSFMAQAKKDNLGSVEKLYGWLQETEKNQTVFYIDALQAIENNWTNAFYTLYYVCPVCGNVLYPQKAEDLCPVCSTDKEEFIPVG